MAVNQFAHTLLAFKPSVQDKEIVISTPNGFVCSPVAKIRLNHPADYTTIKDVILTSE